MPPGTVEAHNPACVPESKSQGLGVLSANTGEAFRSRSNAPKMLPYARRCLFAVCMGDVSIGHEPAFILPCHVEREAYSMFVIANCYSLPFA